MNHLINFEKYYDAFRDISRIVHASVDFDEVLELVAWKNAEMLGAEGASLRIVNLKTQEAEKFVAYGLDEKHLFREPADESEFIRELYRIKKVVVTEDISTKAHVKDVDYLREKDIQTIIDIPLVLRDDLVGVVRLYFKKHVFLSDKELDFIGAVAETCGCSLDKARMIEKQKHQYDQLALQTEKLSALGRLAAGIAHEINNPLAGILLFGTNMRKKVPEDGPVKEGLEVIIKEAQRCKGIIQDLLEFSRDQEPRKTMGGINELIEKALNILNNEFLLHHITVEKDLSDGLPDILMDANLMQQVFVNLLINAIEAIGENGVIGVKSYTVLDMGYILIEITDTGCGIPKDQQLKIFDPFYSTKKSGTGLGLAVSYGIIQKHEGEIHVSSEPAKGTRFTIKIPVMGQTGN